MAVHFRTKTNQLVRVNLFSYSDALKEFIQTCDTPMTVGLQGDWGSGKTSMMNMLRGDKNLRAPGC